MNEVLRPAPSDAADPPIGFLELKRSVDPALFAALQQVMFSPDLKLIVCYCSIFDECWKSDLTTLSLTPPRVKACERPKVPFDEGLSLDRKT